MAVGESGRVALALDRKRVLLADAGRGDIRIYRGHRFDVTFVGFAGERLVSGDDSGRLVIRDWDGHQHAEAPRA